MQTRSKIVLLLGIAAAALLVALALAPRPLEVELAAAQVGRFETTIDEDARTRLADRYVVSAPLAARLDRIALREGDEVKAGDVLATLRPVLSPLLDERSQREQRSRIEAAQANLERASTRIGAARVALERALDEARRTEQLARQGFVSPTKQETDRLAVMAAQKELETAVAGEHVARHELQLAQAAFGVQRAGAGTGAPFVLRSPVAGRVLKRHHQSEATVAPGAPLLEIGDTARLEVVAELLTADALLAVPGSAVQIDRWGGPQPLAGRVARVEPAAFTKVSALGVEEQRVNVIVELTSPREQWAALGDGYRVGVRIVTRSEAKALKVPVGAVFPQPAPAQGYAVFVADGGRVRQQPVDLKGRNGSEAWVAGALAEGAQVVVYPAPAVKDGVRVKPRG